jgi:hypothetical protein
MKKFLLLIFAFCFIASSAYSDGITVTLRGAKKGANDDITSISGLTTPLSVAQGGQGSATLADGGILIGAATGPVEVVAAGATTEILVGGGAGTNPVWTTATGTGAPVRAENSVLVGPALGTPASGDLQNCTAYPGLAITAGKTITATESTSLDEAVSMSSKAPKASPVFTGDVKGTTAGAIFCNQDPTNAGVHYVGSAASVGILDNQTITFTFNGSALFMVYENGIGGYGAVFFAESSSATIIKIADPRSKYEVTDTDTGKIAVFKGAASGVVSIKNYMNATTGLVINILGQVTSATNPT